MTVYRAVLPWAGTFGSFAISSRIDAAVAHLRSKRSFWLLSLVLESMALFLTFFAFIVHVVYGLTVGAWSYATMGRWTSGRKPVMKTNTSS